MTDSMIERVAKAICKSRTCTGIGCCEWPANGAGQTQLRGGPKCLVSDGRFDDAARAAITAMRNLTSEMFQAGRRLTIIAEEERGLGIDSYADTLRKRHEAMIDAALGIKPEGG